jgi:alkylation response protein AidB-like acyl-CoA dehydrogenase
MLDTSLHPLSLNYKCVSCFAFTMQFGLTEEQKDVRQSVRQFAEEEIAPVAKEYNEQEKHPEDLINKAADLGLLGEAIPVEYGGSEMDYLSQTLISEELARVDPGIAVAIMSCGSAALLINDFGTERQKETYLPPTAKGEKTTAIAITEPQAGSDISGMETTAEREGDEYVINGNKIWISNGNNADYVVLFARTGSPSDDRPYEGISAFIVDTDQDGYTARKTDLMGINALHNAELFLDDVRTMKWKRIGEEGEAFYNLMDWFNRNRVRHVAAYGVGLAQGAFEQAFSYAKEREQFSRPIQDFQGIRWKFADMAMKISTTRALTYRTASLLDEGVVSPKLCSIAKIKSSETAREVANEALQIHGGYGYSKEYDIERFYRDAKIMEIFEGTNEVLRNVVAKELIQDNGLTAYLEH